MKIDARVGLALFLAVAAGVACSSKSTPVVNCGLPPPLPIPELILLYPAPGATGVPDAIDSLVFSGNGEDYFGPTTIALTTMSTDGAVSVVAQGTPGPAPSPLPSPLATPSGLGIDTPNSGLPVPTLSPATTYSVSRTYEDFSEQPPTCRTKISETLGTFTTQ
jgi:hypothetical protein